ncbi:MAG: MTH1187 family thiamine-binding protein [Porticoccaceae bacterium]
MNVHVDFCLIPLGGDLSVSAEIAECQRIFRAAGLHAILHAYGTNLEGDWDVVMAAVKACHERVHQMGRVRISSTLKIGTRTDRDQTLADKVASVDAHLVLSRP